MLLTFKNHISPPFQVIELAVSERDIEKEHLSQLRRWKETHGELHCKSPPRMHGAKAIMAAEPPSRQELKQNPTIIVEVPQTTESKTEKGKKTKKTKTEKIKDTKSTSPPPNPYLLPSNPPLPSDNLSPSESQHLQKDTPLQGSNQSLSSGEQDTYL